MNRIRRFIMKAVPQLGPREGQYARVRNISFRPGGKGLSFRLAPGRAGPPFPFPGGWPTVNDVSIQRVPPLKLRLGAISVRDCTFTAPSHYGSRRPGRPRPGWRAVLANVLRCSASLGG